MGYQIFAVIVFIAASVYIGYTVSRCSEIDAKCKGQLYHKERKIAKATVMEDIHKDGVCFLRCFFPEDVKHPFSILCERDDCMVCPYVWLMQFKTKKVVIYSLLGPDNKGLPPTQNIPSKSMEVNEEEARKVNGEIYKRYVFIAGMMFVSLLAVLVQMPSLTIGFAVGSVYLAIFNRPFKRWTKSKKWCIIKIETQKKKAKSGSEDNLPVGYKDWTDTEREIFQIEQSLLYNAEDKSSTFEVTTSSGEDDFSNLCGSETPNNPEVSPFTADLIENDESSRIQLNCMSCGKDVFMDMQFCPHCGANQRPCENDNGNEDVILLDLVEDDSFEVEIVEDSTNISMGNGSLDSDFSVVVDAGEEEIENGMCFENIEVNSKVNNESIDEEISVAVQTETPDLTDFDIKIEEEVEHFQSKDEPDKLQVEKQLEESHNLEPQPMGGIQKGVSSFADEKLSSIGQNSKSRSSTNAKPKRGKNRTDRRRRGDSGSSMDDILQSISS